MNNFLKISGLILVFIAVVILIFEVKSGINNNTLLLISAAMILVGLTLFVIMNKKLL